MEDKLFALKALWIQRLNDVEFKRLHAHDDTEFYLSKGEEFCLEDCINELSALIEDIGGE